MSEEFDDFLTIPDADTVLTVEEQNKEKMFEREKDADLSFMDEQEKELVDERTEEEKQEDAEKAMSLLDEEEEEEDEDVKKQIDKDSVAGMFSSLIKDGVLIGFDDDKDLSEYSNKDFKELLQANIDEKINIAKQETPKQFFESLPEELQYAAVHVAKGNKDLKSVFRALADREEVKELDPNNEKHVESIARQYLQATNYGYGDNDIIEEQIQEWIESGAINKKAKLFKPKLDKMQEKILESKLKKQEEFQEVQAQKRKSYINDIYETLKEGELNGVKINNKMQNFLYSELTTTKYESMSGKPTNLLGKLLEEHQYGEKPRMDLIAEATWLLSNPEEYKAQLLKKSVSDTNKKTVDDLKTEQSRKLKSSNINVSEDEKITKKKHTLKKQKNIFSRR